ncbi:MAG: hypothetical protein ACNA7V_14710 [Bacteroidales bacterium]
MSLLCDEARVKLYFYQVTLKQYSFSESKRSRSIGTEGVGFFKVVVATIIYCMPEQT